MFDMLIILTILSIISSACLSWVLYKMIQPTAILGGWQKVLEKIYGKSEYLAMFLGYCYKCFSHFIGIVSFCLYLIIQNHINWLGWWNILLYMGFVASSIVFSMFINKHLTEDEL